MEPKRRNPLEKGRWLESNREKWALVYTIIGLIVMIATGYGFIRDPAVFMAYFSGIIMVLIAGASADSALKIWKIDSSNTTTTKYTQETTTENVNVKKDENLNQNIKIDETYTENIKTEGENGPSRKPFSRDAVEE